MNSRRHRRCYVVNIGMRQTRVIHYTQRAAVVKAAFTIRLYKEYTANTVAYSRPVKTVKV